MAERESPHSSEPFARQKQEYANLEGQARQDYIKPLREDLKDALVEQDWDEALSMDAERTTQRENELLEERMGALNTLSPETREEVLRERQSFEDVSKNELLSDERKEAILKRMFNRDHERAKELYDPESGTGKALEAEEAKALEAARETIRLSEQHGERWSQDEKDELIGEVTEDVVPSAKTLDETVEKEDAGWRNRVGRKVRGMPKRFGSLLDQPVKQYGRAAWNRTKTSAHNQTGESRQLLTLYGRGAIELVGMAAFIGAKGIKKGIDRFRKDS